MSPLPYLIEHPPKTRQFRERGTTPSGVVVIHTAESTPDWVGEDTGAEGVASFIANRSDFGSYHVLCDSDTILPLVPFALQAYGDGTGSNPHAVHISAATQAAKWPQAPKEWRAATVKNMAVAAARYSRWLEHHGGPRIPARRITRDQSDLRVPGFISHAERDPGRRTDPGKDYPWDLFLKFYRAELHPDTRVTLARAAIAEQLYVLRDEVPKTRVAVHAMRAAIRAALKKGPKR